MITSCTVYDDLLAKSHKGIDFYKKLQIGVQKLLQRTQAVVQKNQEDRINKMERFKPKPGRASKMINQWMVHLIYFQLSIYECV